MTHPAKAEDEPHASRSGRAAAAAVGLLGAGVALARQTVDRWSDACRPLATPEDYLVTAAGATATVATMWLLLGVVLAVLSDLPGVAGRVARALADRILPSVLRRWTSIVVGAAVGIGAGGAVSSTALAHPGSGPVARLDRSTSLATTVNVTRGSSTPTSALPDPGWGELVAPAPAPATPAGRAAGHRVATGDCLWSIAQAGLPSTAPAPAIDREWRRWYTQNRHVVGPDPDLIRPGQYLTAPPVAKQTRRGES